ncbi:arp2/3 complex-activating protein rickA-like [Girardinichthys multiradiatus]|uniref:arp2/3 complex-activating protein rickA-like n=1 Tax=Girardinichthys multiradiatus TaxID=208333 RepID=UPI001FAC0314|nr:arp2/3 complex-activating protein rickA-like [Girardinichthys multiradiatus]
MLKFPTPTKYPQLHFSSIWLLLQMDDSSPWRRLEIAGSLQDWLEARKHFFPDQHIIEAEQQRALGETVASMRRPPAPSSARLSTEAGAGFPAHGLVPDQPSPLLQTPNPVPGPVPDGFLDELPPHPDPVPGSVLEGSRAEPPSYSAPVREGLVDELPPSLVPVPEEFVEDVSPLPVPVHEGCEDAPSPPPVSRRLSDHRLLRCWPADRLPQCRQPADRQICPGRPPGRPPELWVYRGRPPIFVLFCGHLGSTLKGRVYVILACFEFLSLCFC